MSRARKHETPQHAKERNRQRLRAAEKRKVAGEARRRRVRALYRGALEVGARLIWSHVPRSWARRLRVGKPLP